MDYYKRYMGDYGRDTGRLSLIEHGAYTLLLDDYYSRREPLPPDLSALHRICRATTKGEQNAVDSVAKQFFPLSDDGLRHNWRADEEIAKWNELSTEAASSGKLGAEARWGKQRQKESRSQRLSAARKLGTHTDVEWRCLIKVCGNKCLRCGTPIEELEGAIVCKDHINPLYLGGSDGIENLQPLCRQCNTGKKSDVTDLRPADWRARLAECMAVASNDARRNAWRSPSEMSSSRHPLSVENEWPKNGSPIPNPNPNPNPEIRGGRRAPAPDGKASANGRSGSEGKDPPPQSVDSLEFEQVILANYPKGSNPPNWMMAIRHASDLVRDGLRTWPELVEDTLRYARFIAGGGSGGVNIAAHNFFDRRKGNHWSQSWDLPSGKGSTPEPVLIWHPTDDDEETNHARR